MVAAMVPIWSDEEGDVDAPLVALIHGTMDRSTGMLRLSRRLDQRFRVLRYDRRGYGRSVGGDGLGPFDMAAQVGDLFELLAGRRAVLVGHSFGGNVALAAAARHPDLVAGVAIYEAPLSWEPWWPSDTAGSIATTASVSLAAAAELFMRRLVGDATWEALPERTRATRRSEGAALVGELNDLRANRPWSPAEVLCPVVVSRGSKGTEHHRRGMELVHEWLPSSSMLVLDGCRHDAPMSNSELFASTVVAAIVEAAGDPWAAVNRRRAPGAAS